MSEMSEMSEIFEMDEILDELEREEERFDELPIIPIRGDLVVFPYMPPIPPFSPHHIALSGKTIAVAVEDAMVNGDRILCLFRQRNGDEKDLSQLNKEDLHPIGSLVYIVRYKKDGQNVLFMAQGRARVRIKEIVQTNPFMIAKVEVVEDLDPVSSATSDEREALMRSIIDIFNRIVANSVRYQEDFAIIAENIDEPGRLADYVAAIISIKTEERQKILEAVNIEERLKLLIPALTKELRISEIEGKIQSDAQAELSDMQKEHILREQLKAIQRELGDSDDLSIEIEDLREKIEKINMPEKARKAADRELKKLSQMQSYSPEATVSRNYLDWMVNLPWDESSKDQLDVDEAQKILDEDHYNLTKVKDRILEFLAVRSLKPDVKGAILCFVGPPGVGKTSLGKSIARAMERQFVRISLGGVRDEAEIRGHRRTYIGSMPGRVIKGLKQAEKNNPVFMLDEIDKLGSDFRGDPSSALLEVLDPEQNNSFVDHYLGVPFDLSNVMFIATANQTHTIPPALLDRMETLDLPGYTTNEKIEIAKQYLIPRQLDQHGITTEQIEFTDRSILTIVESFTREAGLRNLEREIGTVCRKIARKIAQGEKEKTVILENDLEKHLGPIKFFPEVAERRGEIGVATGMAFTPFGGEILFVEGTRMSGDGKMTITGQIGDVMQESAKAAMTCIRSKSEDLDIEPDFFKKNDFHIHVPAGAIPKDGPSAGITIATVLASLATGKEISPTTAMTGEISLRGRVLPIGGLKEKVLAAKQAGIERVIIPSKNQKDMIDVPQDAKEGLEFIFVDRIDQVLRQAFISN